MEGTDYYHPLAILIILEDEYEDFCSRISTGTGFEIRDELDSLAVVDSAKGIVEDYFAEFKVLIEKLDKTGTPMGVADQLEADAAAVATYVPYVMRCWACNEEGHKQHECPKLKPRTTTGTFRCFKCDEEGYRQFERPNDYKNSPLAKRFKTTLSSCWICAKVGYKAHECRNEFKSTTPAPASRPDMHRCWICDEVGHEQSDCPTRHGETTSDYRCRTCFMFGHRQNNCPERNRVAKRNNLTPSSLTTFTTSSGNPTFEYARITKPSGYEKIRMKYSCN